MVGNVLLLALLLMAWLAPLDAEAACTGASPTWTSSSDYASVNTCVTNAVDGDTINVSAGSSTWTSTLTIAKAISLIGAGIGNTVITSDTGVTNGTLIKVNTKASGGSPAGFMRLSGFTLTSGVNCFGSADFGLLIFTGPSAGPTANLRMDNNRVIINNVCVGSVFNTVYGVVDHNTFDINTQNQPVTYFDLEGNTHGDVSWAAADDFGTANALYFEDNTFNGHSTNFLGTDGWRGARVVFRYNAFDDVVYSDHGTESSGRNRGMRLHEIYSNTFNYTSHAVSSVLSSRGGTGVIYSNTITTSGSGSVSNLALLSAFRSSQRGPGFTDWGKPFCACGAFTVTSLTRSGSTATVVTSGGTRWAFWGAAGQPVGTAACQITISGADQAEYNGTFQPVSTPDDVTFTYAVSGTPATPATGTIKAFSVFDGNTDDTGYRCLDQPGAGVGTLLHDDNPATVNPLCPSNLPCSVGNALSPVYYWNNTINGAAATASSTAPDAVVENRDFYNATIKPGYTAFCYPHPLVSGVACGVDSGSGGKAPPRRRR